LIAIINITSCRNAPKTPRNKPNSKKRGNKNNLNNQSMSIVNHSKPMRIPKKHKILQLLDRLQMKEIQGIPTEPPRSISRNNKKRKNSKHLHNLFSSKLQKSRK